MPWAFADNLAKEQGAESSGLPEGKAYLLQIAQRNPKQILTSGEEVNVLIEAVVQPDNLAKALLKVMANQGAPGMDGQGGIELFSTYLLIFGCLHSGQSGDAG